ncbi:MAG: hypothetical protein JXX14_18180, partial [Deltaproteobacteria bacterium]|nr:hypothetical protein [Deltaproteobacteria bacterium]
ACVIDESIPEMPYICIQATMGGDSCEMYPCAPGWFCNMDSICEAVPATVGEDCTAAERCVGDLRCMDSTFADRIVCPEGVQSCCQETGNLKQPCRKDWSCNDGLTCFAAGGVGVCMEALTPCAADVPCDEGFQCLSAEMTGEMYCMPAGNEKEPCWYPDYVCNEGLECVTDITQCFPFNNGEGSCCLPPVPVP